MRSSLQKMQPSTQPTTTVTPVRNAASGPRPATAQGLSARVSRWPTRPQSRAQGFSSTAKHSRAFTSIRYDIPGEFQVLAQPSSMACWATVFTMLKSWRSQRGMTIEQATASVGQRWLDLYRADTGLSGDDKVNFISTAGLVAEPPQSYSIQGWETLLRNYGPIWVTTDEAPGKAWAIHARIITGIYGDGTPEGTCFKIVDPAGGRRYEESIAVFIPKYEEEVIRTGYMRIQVVHWQTDGRSEQRARSLGRSQSHAATPSTALSRSYPPDFTAALAAQQRARQLSNTLDVCYNVELVPQQTGMSCWAAGFAMIVGWRDRVSINPEEIARASGHWAQYQSGLNPEDVSVMQVWGFVPEPPQSYMISAFANLLRRYGPLWVASAEPGPHIRVITGIRGDGTPDGTTLYINDPWEQGMTSFQPSNRGAQYTETFRQFEEKQATLATRERNVRAPIYIAHLPALPAWMSSPAAQSFSHFIGRPLAMEAPSNPENFRLLTSGLWNGNATLNVRGGQAMWFKIRNTNVLGTTIRISDQSGQVKQSVILPASSVEFVFSIFGTEPMGWRFDIRSESDAFAVTWELWSTWVEGMPPNR
ncbi:Hypothetical protein HDN1F_21880 [gamma proteobacterium HdN1]|nr:Hypothetical protein HDN1F_21880 [gamma proteobacterium HdN1]